MIRDHPAEYAAQLHELAVELWPDPATRPNLLALPRDMQFERVKMRIRELKEQGAM